MAGNDSPKHVCRRCCTLGAPDKQQRRRSTSILPTHIALLANMQYYHLMIQDDSPSIRMNVYCESCMVVARVCGALRCDAVHGGTRIYLLERLRSSQTRVVVF